MTLYINNPSKLALANGTAASSSNTGGAAGVTLPPVYSATGTITFQSGKWRHIHGTGVARFDLPITATSMLSTEVLYEGSTPTAGSRIVEVRHASGYALLIVHGDDGKLYLHDSANVNVFTTAAAVTSPFRVHVGIQKGTTSSNGKIRFDVYTANSGLSTTPSETFSSDTSNVGTADLTTVRFGRISTTTDSTPIDLVNLQVSDTQITSLGPLVTADPPVASAAAPGDVVIDARASTTGGGGTLTYSISPSTGTSQPTSGLFLVPAPTTSTTYTVTVTESPSGLTDTADATVEPATPTSGVRTLVFDGTDWV